MEGDMKAALEGVRVLDLSSGPVGGIATMVLADFGADVAKVERPGGDPFRASPGSIAWLRGKRSVVLDLSTAYGQGHLRSLVETADVVVATFRPGQATKLGADFATLAEINRQLIYCSITGFGPRGPYARYPGYEGIVQAKSGRMQMFEGLLARKGPIYAAVPLATHATSQAAVQGILAALFAREQRQGRRAQLLETSLLQGMLPYDVRGLVHAVLSHAHPEVYGLKDTLSAARGTQPTLNYHPVQTKDGRWIQLGNLLQHQFDAFVFTADLGDVYLDGDHDGPPGSWPSELLEDFRDRMLARMRELTLQEWMAKFSEAGPIAAEPYATTQEAMRNPDVVLNGHVLESEDQKLGRLLQVGPIAHLEATPASPRIRAREVGADTAEVLLDQWSRRISTRPNDATEAAPESETPLAGIVVAEFATIIATPLAVAFLADLGARVVKVEPPGGDPYRQMGPGAAAGIAAAKTTVGKESICLDLKTPRGREVAAKLMAKADIVIHNYRPGVPERLGISYQQVARLRPDIIYLTMNGYGPNGPSAHRAAAHPIAGAAMGGALYQAGPGMPPLRCNSIQDVREAARRLMRANEPSPDPSTSMIITSAVLLALYARQRHGFGQQIFVDMLVANAYANFDDFYWHEGRLPRHSPDPELFGLGPLYRLYPASAGWVFLAVLSDREWKALCKVMPEAGLDPSGFDRREELDDLSDRLGKAFAAREADEWERLLTAAGVGCVRADAASPGAFFAEDEHVRANGFAPEVVHPSYGLVRRHGSVVTMEGMADQLRPGVLAGQHTDSILVELGYDQAEVEALREEGVAWSEDAVDRRR